MGVEAQPEDENLCEGTPSDVDRRTPKLFPALTSTSRLNLKHLCARTATVVAPAGAWSVSPLMKDRGNARIIVAARWAAVNVAVWTSMSILLAGRNEDAVDSR